MLTNDGKRLQLFRGGIEVDKKLPKWSVVLNKATDNIVDKVSLDTLLDGPISNLNVTIGEGLLNSLRNQKFSTSSFTIENREVSDGSVKRLNSESDEKVGFFKRIFRRSKKNAIDLTSKDEEPIEEYQLDILEFFSEVKLTSQNAKDSYIDRIKGYITAIKNAEISGQVALQEQLKSKLIINKYESVLYASGLYLVVTENQIVDFVKKTRKGVRLDYIKNFVRPIPTEVIEKKLEADKLEVFDNYVIMHYDPELKSFAETEEDKRRREEEKRRKKDPILFGVISGSNKLYYITDWIDEVCNLTLDEFVDTLKIEKDNLKLNDKL